MLSTQAEEEYNEIFVKNRAALERRRRKRTKDAKRLITCVQLKENKAIDRLLIWEEQ